MSEHSVMCHAPAILRPGAAGPLAGGVPAHLTLSGVIRHVALIHFKPEATPQQVEDVVAGLRAIPFEGLLNLTIGRDAGLRNGNADLAIVADFVDEASCRAYDVDAEHSRVRRELLAPILASVERCQLRAG
jgi:hypothetical protein